MFRGAIKFFTEPPALEKAPTESTSIVGSLSKPFSLDDFVPNNDVEMDDTEDTEEPEDQAESGAPMEDSLEQKMETEPEETNRRVTRSAAKKSVTFAVDDNATNELLQKRSTKRQTKPEAAISPEGQKKLGLVATKKTIMKKLRKSKKKNSKQASALSDLVDSLTM